MNNNQDNRNKKNGRESRDPLRTGLPLLALAVVIVLLFNWVYNSITAAQLEEKSYSDFLTMVQNNQLAEVQFQTDRVLFITKEEANQPGAAQTIYYTGLITGTDNTALVYKMQGQGVKVFQEPQEDNSVIGFILSNLLILGLTFFLLSLLMRKMGSTMGGLGNVGQSKAKVYMEKQTGVTFADVAGQDEAKESLQEIIDFLHNPQKYAAIGAKLPKGALLVGSPGTGKTLLAKAVAGEANVPFFSISGSDFVEMFVGVGASRVRDLFSTAKKCAPAVVFIDEIDAVGRQRGAGLGGGHDEREQTLNQLLVEMDGFAINEGIIVLAATNRPDILDPALLRPGRFDRQITVNYPDVKGREEILKVHAKGKPLAEDVSLAVLAKRTSGFTGADLENVLNEAAILAARYKKKKITMLELEEAITRTVVGPEKKSRVVTDEDKKVTAYHEAGHAIVALKMPHCDPVHEVSIIPRGAAAGYTMTMPDTDDNHVSRGKILDEICMCMGGRVAESIALDDVCTGAIGDLKRASELARRMVIEFGMSDAIGPVFLGGDTEVFIAKDWGHQRNYSEEVAAKVDAEMRRILEEQFDRAKAVLEENREAMDRVVKALLEYERIDGDQFIKIFNGESIEIRSYKDRKADLEKPDEEVLAQEQAQAAAKEAQVPPTAPEQPAQPEQPEQPDEK